ncbi:MAG: HEAT repeat domain-containing protein [Arenimonas sp.]
MNMRLSRVALLAAIAIMAIAAIWVTRGNASASVEGPLTPVLDNRDGALAASNAVNNIKSPDKKSQRGHENFAYLREVMRQYTFETELDKRGALLAILQSMPNEEVKQFALEQAASSDPVTRREGLELLKAFSLDDAKVRGLLVDQINQEQDPAMLKDLVDMLAPTMVATEDAAPLVEQLARLRTHPDPEVRAASIMQSTQWDKGSDLENTLQQAMMDPDTRVRQAAIGGVKSERVHSDRLKNMLLVIATDAQTSDTERTAAIFALEGFALNRSEYELYRHAGQLVVAGH